MEELEPTRVEEEPQAPESTTLENDESAEEPESDTLAASEEPNLFSALEDEAQ